MGNKLNFDALVGLEEKQYQQEEVKLQLKDNTFVVKYDKVFRDTKIQELIKEWVKIKEVNNIVNQDVNMYDISFILILKHFTDIPFYSFDDTLKQTEHYIRMTNLLLDIKDIEGVSLFEKVYSVLSQEEIKKVTEHMNKTSLMVMNEVNKLFEEEDINA